MSLMFILFLLSQCSVLAKSSNLIESTCKQTPYYKLCVSSLNSDPLSAQANDVSKLALIMVHMVATKTNDTLNHIQHLRGHAPDPKVQKALDACIGSYNTVAKDDVPEAVAALTKGDYKFAVQGMTDAANEADACEAGFSKSPMTVMNKNIHELSVAAASIATILL